MERTDARFLRERETLVHMVAQYCSTFHRPGLAPLASNLCDTCAHLMTYAEERLLKCPFSVDKPACTECTIHCYAQKERELVKLIMRYSGPRIGLQRPWLALFHLWDQFRSKARVKKWKSTKQSRQ